MFRIVLFISIFVFCTSFLLPLDRNKVEISSPCLTVEEFKALEVGEANDHFAKKRIKVYEMEVNDTLCIGLFEYLPAKAIKNRVYIGVLLKFEDKSVLYDYDNCEKTLAEFEERYWAEFTTLEMEFIKTRFRKGYLYNYFRRYIPSE